MDLDTLTSMVGADPVEDAETRGLIRIVAEHQGVDVRFNHPLFGELIRRRAAARRLRGELVRALRDQPLRTPARRIRWAELTLDSDEAPDVELLVTAARDAIALTNITLGERLISSAGQYLAWGMANVLIGTIELARGSFLEAMYRMEQTVAALTSESAAS